MSFSRVLNTTIREYFRTETPNIMRRRRLLAWLKSKGLITTGHGGLQHEWKVRTKRVPLQYYADAERLAFARSSKRRAVSVPWRSIVVTDSHTKMEQLQQQNAEAIIKAVAMVGKELSEDITEGFCPELFVNGDATGNDRRIWGLETALKGTSPASGGYIATNSGSYAGLSTVLGALGGTWTGTWPNGDGDYQYDAWSGLLVDYSDAAWATAVSSPATFKETAVEALRYGIINSERNDNKLDLILLDKEMYRQFLDTLDPKERVMVERNRKDSKTVSLGFGDVQHFDGVDVTWEHGVPANTGYGLCMDGMELMSMQKSLFSPEVKDFDIEGMSMRFAVDFYGNMKLNPRKLVKFYNYTT